LKATKITRFIERKFFLSSKERLDKELFSHLDSNFQYSLAYTIAKRKPCAFTVKQLSL